MKKILALASLLALVASCGGTPTPTSSLTLTTSSNSVTFSGKLRLTATPSNLANISKVEFFDGASKLGEDSTTPYTLDILLTSSSNGTKNYKATTLETNNATASSAVSSVAVNIVAGFALLGSQVNATADDFVNTWSRGLVVDANDIPYMVFTEANNKKIVVRKWVADAWQQVGDTVSQTSSDALGLGLDANGNPVVSYAEINNLLASVYVKKWNGSAWQQLGNTLTVDPTSNASRDSQMAFDSSNNPVVVFSEQVDKNLNTYVKKWNGSTWQSLGGALDIDLAYNAYQPSLALTTAGDPVVAWTESKNTASNIHVKKWNGSAWQSLGGALDMVLAQATTYPALALDSSDNPMVAWSEKVSANQIFVKKWNGSAWQQVGSTSLNTDGTQNATDTDIGFDAAGTAVVVWKESLASGFGVFAKKWTGSTWQQIGSTPVNTNPSLESFRPALAFDSQNNLFVGWLQKSTIRHNVYLSRFNQ